MNADRAMLRTAVMPHTYWQVALIDTVYKNKLIGHSKTGYIPLHKWNDNIVQIPPLYMFGHIGRVQKLPITEKLTFQGTSAGYVGI